MRKFKPYLNFVSVGVVAMALAACNLPKPEESKNQVEAGATFVAEPVTGKEVLQHIQSGSLVPTSKVFQFATCLKDLKSNKVIGHEFQIVELNVTTKTDAAGCLHWQEEVSFDYLKSAKFIQLDRTLKATTFHKGQRALKIGVNPWADKENVADLSQEHRPNVISEQANSDAEQTSDNSDGSLMVKTITYKVRENLRNSEKVQLVYDVDFFPQLITRDINNQVVVRDLAAGDFEMTAYILSSNKSNGRYPILAKTTSIQTASPRLGISAGIVFDVPCIPTTKDLFFALQLKPKSKIKVAAFEGLYTIGIFDLIKVGSRLELNPMSTEKSFKLANILGEKMDSRSCLQEGYQKPEIEVAKLDFKFYSVGNETTTTRDYNYKVTACLKDGIDQKNVRSANVRITKFRTSTSQPAEYAMRSTDNNSCVSWDETITHKFYECQHFHQGIVELEDKAIGLHKIINVAVNPWEKYLVGQDLRYSGANENIRYACTDKDQNATLTFKNYYMNPYSDDKRTWFRFEIDKYLGLKVFRKYLLRVEPQVFFYSDLGEGRQSIKHLRDGVYLFRVAVAIPLPEGKFKLIDGLEKISEVTNGNIAVEVEFGTYDLKEFGNRNVIMMEALPVHEDRLNVRPDGSIEIKSPYKDFNSVIYEDAGLVSSTHFGNVILSENNNSNGLENIDRDKVMNYMIHNVAFKTGTNIIPELLKQKERIQAEVEEGQRKLADVRYFAAANNLVMLNPYDMAQTAVMRKSLGANIDDGIFGNYGSVSSEDFYDKLKTAPGTSSHQAFDELISTGKLSPINAQRMCLYWFREFLPRLHSEKGGVVSRLTGTQAVYNCLKATAKDPSSFFWTERRLLVKEIGKVDNPGGENQGYSLAVNYSVSNAHSDSFGTSKSISGNLLNITYRFLELFSVGISGGYSMTWSKNDSLSNSNAQSFNKNKNLNEYSTDFKIELKEYTECATLKMNLEPFFPIAKAEMLDLFGQSSMKNLLNPGLTDIEMTQALTRGFLICKPTTTKKPIVRNESFFVLAQELPANATGQDSTDPKNRPLFIGIRGTEERDRLASILSGNLEFPKDADKTGISSTKIQKALRMTFKTFTSFPGNYKDDADKNY